MTDSKRCDETAGAVVVAFCAHHGAARLCGDGLPAPLTGFAVRPSQCAQRESDCRHRPQVALVFGADPDSLRRALATTGRCVETCDGRLPLHRGLAAEAGDRGLYMALSTASAHATEPARLFAAVLADRVKLTAAAREDIALALHEAVANAVLHGNLEVDASGRQSLEGFPRFCEEVGRRLADPALAGRWVEIAARWTDRQVVLTVADDGAGYAAPSPSPAEDAARKSGRGLGIIRALAERVAIEDGGRRLCMTFPR